MAWLKGEQHMSERTGGRRTRTAPNRPNEGNGGDPTPTLSESPAQTKGLFAESETEVFADAVIADAGGAAAIEDLKAADTGVLPKKRFGPVFWVSVAWVV